VREARELIHRGERESQFHHRSDGDEERKIRCLGREERVKEREKKTDAFQV